MSDAGACAWLAVMRRAHGLLQRPLEYARSTSVWCRVDLARHDVRRHPFIGKLDREPRSTFLLANEQCEELAHGQR